MAGLLLLATKDEETVFWLLTVLIRNILPSYYSQDMQGLITDMAVLEHLVRQKSPRVDKLLVDLSLAWPVIATKWFICLFAEVLPVEVSRQLNCRLIFSFLHTERCIRTDCLPHMGLPFQRRLEDALPSGDNFSQTSRRPAGKLHRFC